MGSWQFNIATRTLSCTPQCKVNFGLAPNEYLSFDELLALIHPEDRAQRDAIVEKSLKERSDYATEYRLLLPSGEIRWIAARGRALYDESGNPIELFGVTQNITERKLAEQALNITANLLHLVTDSAPLLLSYVDSDLRYRFVNQEYAKWFGLPKEQIIGKTVPEIIGQAAFQATRPKVEAVLAGERVSMETTLLYAEGAQPRYVHLDMVPDFDANRKVRGYVVIVVDHTARKAASEALSRKDRDLESILASVTDGFISWDRDWRFTYVNAEGARILGHPASELIGKGVLEMFPDLAGTPFYYAYQEAMQENHVIEITDYFPPFETWFEVRAYPSETGLSLYLRDIADQRETQEALRLSEERYRSLTLATNQIVWWTDGEGAIVRPVPLWEEFTGQTEAEYRGWGWLNAVHPEDRPTVTAAWHAAIAAKTSYDIAYRLYHRDGSYRYMEVRAAPIPGPQGGISEWIGANTDVTKQQETQERERFLANLTEQTRLLIDPDEVVRETVRSVGEFLKLSRYLFVDIDTDADTVTVHQDYINPTDPHAFSIAGVWPLAPWGKVLEDSRAGRTVVNRDYQTDPRTAGSWEDIYKQTSIRANVTVPLMRDGKWVAAFSAHMCDAPRNWTQGDVELLEAVAHRMWLTLENARLRRGEREAIIRQRRFLREMLFGLTEGRLRLCDTVSDLPPALPPASDEVALAPNTLRVVRKQLEAVTTELEFEIERTQDFETAVHEAAMNAVRHAGSGKARVHADATAGVTQVWIQDNGEGIAEHLIHRAIERGWTTGGFGQGFWLMLRCADRVYLLTGPNGTTIVLEQERVPPKPLWMQADL
jgi:PAS domain S-box-containing protein